MKTLSDLYADIMYWDSELARVEPLIDSLAAQIGRIESRGNTNNVPGIRAALAEARVLANDALTRRNKAIDLYMTFVESHPDLKEYSEQYKVKSTDEKNAES